MRLLAVGGGSGGHVTPVLAVINELKRLDNSLQVEFVCDKAFAVQAKGIMDTADIKIPVKIIMAGKLRRYRGVSFWSQLMDFSTNWHNFKDIFLVIGGLIQSLVILLKYNPDVVFAKGGYVCLPVGVAAKWLNIPLVIHDSDNHPGLTNKILSRWATKIGTGAPLENYSYRAAISRYVGVPIDPAFKPLKPAQQTAAKAEIGVVDLKKPLVVVVGGGLGAKTINEAVVAAADDWLKRGIGIYHVTGQKHFDAIKKRATAHASYQLVPFIYKNMPTVLGAADLVITRGSATFLQELAALAKPAIIVPAAHLHDQAKNAVVYETAQAAVVLSDQDLKQPHLLSKMVVDLLNDNTRTSKMAAKLHEFARPDAALDVAQLIVSAARTKR